VLSVALEAVGAVRVVHTVDAFARLDVAHQVSVAILGRLARLGPDALSVQALLTFSALAAGTAAAIVSALPCASRNAHVRLKQILDNIRGHVSTAVFGSVHGYVGNSVDGNVAGSGVIG